MFVIIKYPWFAGNIWTFKTWTKYELLKTTETVFFMMNTE